MLTELWEIDFALGEVKDRIRDNNNPTSATASPI